MSRFVSLLFLLFAFCLTSSARWEPSQLQDPYASDHTHYVSDKMGYLSAFQKDTLDHLCAYLDERARLHVSIVILDQLEDDQEDFPSQLFRQWECASYSRSIMLVLQENTQKWNFILNEGANEALTDTVKVLLDSQNQALFFQSGGSYLVARHTLWILYETAKANFFYGVRPRSQMEAESNDDYSQFAHYFLFLWVLMLFFGSFVPEHITGSDSFDRLQAKIDCFPDDDDGPTVVLTSNAHTLHWDVWDNRYFMRNVAFNFVFFFVVWFAYRSDVPLVAGLVGTFIYATFRAFAWKALARRQLQGVSALEAYVRTGVVLRSKALALYCVLAPHVMRAFRRQLEQEVEDIEKVVFSCPVCKSPTTPEADGAQRPARASQLCEDPQAKCQMRLCPNGHHLAVVSVPLNSNSQESV